MPQSHPSPETATDYHTPSDHICTCTFVPPPPKPSFGKLFPRDQGAKNDISVGLCAFALISVPLVLTFHTLAPLKNFYYWLADSQWSVELMVCQPSSLTLSHLESRLMTLSRPSEHVRLTQHYSAVMKRFPKTDRGGAVVRLLTSRLGEPVSIPGGVATGFSRGGIVLVGGFSQRSPISHALTFRRCSILTSITLISSQDLDVKSRRDLLTLSFRAAPECKGGGKRDIPEKTRRPAASSGMIPICENPGVTSPGIELGSPRREAICKKTKWEIPKLRQSFREITLSLEGIDLYSLDSTRLVANELSGAVQSNELTPAGHRKLTVLAKCVVSSSGWSRGAYNVSVVSSGILHSHGEVTNTEWSRSLVPSTPAAHASDVTELAIEIIEYLPPIVTANFLEAPLKFYFQVVPPPHANQPEASRKVSTVGQPISSEATTLVNIAVQFPGTYGIANDSQGGVVQ
ncbi:hypothetical protein PR048_018910 [Dryococelus australis]|uniref:Uncharacterized protein n=1 Tax=Dryococelus australis TaxID=614101 RepID=A0ABQ9H2C6_9NEOP|nr:hypothetical protein PR048_018910 [Dryococelus australis]